MTQLMAANTRRVDLQEVMAVPSPEFTDSWHPISHGEVVTALKAACDTHGIGIRSEEYSLSANGAKMFGVWELDLLLNGTHYSLGLRNAIDKSLGVGVTAGTKVLVCDNLCFSGDYIKFRKHTSGLDADELQTIAHDAVGGAIIEMEKLYDWQNGLHEIYVPKNDHEAMVYDMVVEGVFSGGKINRFLQCLEEERAIRKGGALDGATSLYNMHGAATRLMRDQSLIQVAKATPKLNQICDDYRNMKLAA
jgi:hypothetical protein